MTGVQTCALPIFSSSHRALVVDLSVVPFLDSTAANMLEGLARKAARRNVRLVLTGTTHDVRQELFAHGLKPPLARYERSIDVALRKLHRVLEFDAARHGQR